MLLLLLPLVPLVIVLYLVRQALLSRNNYSGRHVLITGGSSGIGLSVAKLFARKGANVTIVARNTARLEAAKAEIEKCTVTSEQVISSVSVDLTESVETISSAFAQPTSVVGQVDVLVNNAGAAVCGAFLDLDEGAFMEQLQRNYMSSVNVTRAVLPSMVMRRSGQIAYVSSMAGQFGLYGYTAYSASKFALRGLAEALHMEVKPFGVRVSLVFPPDTDTPGFANENTMKPIATQRLSESGGLFTPDQVAEKILAGLERNRFAITVGLDGYVLSLSTCGMSPSSSIMESFPQVMLCGVFRMVGLVYLWMFDRIVRRSVQEEGRL